MVTYNRSELKKSNTKLVFPPWNICGGARGWKLGVISHSVIMFSIAVLLQRKELAKTSTDFSLRPLPDTKLTEWRKENKEIDSKPQRLFLRPLKTHNQKLVRATLKNSALLPASVEETKNELSH